MKKIILLFVFLVFVAHIAKSAEIWIENDITSDTTWTNNNVYVLEGWIHVLDDVTLTIEPGTIIKGAPGNFEDASGLIISRGGRLNAIGTLLEPIIFTAYDDDLLGSLELSADAVGLWGGIVLLGKATINNISEGGELLLSDFPNNPNNYGGGTDDDDTTAIMKYVSIRYAGTIVADNEEMNALTLVGCGSGTHLSYVEVFTSTDDGVEIFGGTPKLDHIVSGFAFDEILDTDLGARPEIQFFYGVQQYDENTGLGQRCGEHDGGMDSDEWEEPYAKPIISNATFIGKGATHDGNNDLLFDIRDNSGAVYRNSVFFETDAGIRIEIAEAHSSYDFWKDGELVFKNNVFFNVGSNDIDNIFSIRYGDLASNHPDSAIAKTNLDDYFATAGNAISDPGISYTNPVPANPGNVSSPNFSGLPDWFETVDYQGAFDPDEENWAEGWTKTFGGGLLPRVNCAVAEAVTPGTYTANHRGGVIDQWYKYNATMEGTLKIYSCGLTDDDTKVNIYVNGCGPENLYKSDDDGCDFQSVVYVSLDSGDEIYIEWSSEFEPEDYDWTIEFIDGSIPVGVDCKNPKTATEGSNTSDHTNGLNKHWFIYTPEVTGDLHLSTSSPDVFFAILHNICPSNEISELTYDSEEVWAWVEAGKPYLIYTDNNNSTSIDWNLEITEDTPPEGVACFNPFTANIGTNSADNNDDEQWYSFTPDESGTATVSSCGSTSEDTYVEIYSDCSGGFITSGDDNCGDTQSEISFDVIAGQEYLIAWKDWYTSNSYNWELSLTTKDEISVIISSSNASCEQSDGTATAIATGGTAPYTYQWSNGQTTQQATELSAGIYIVRVKDAAGKTGEAIATIKDEGAPEITANIKNARCFGEKDGSIDLSLDGGTPPFSFKWSNGDFSQDIVGLSAGPYEVLIKDAANCVTTESFFVSQPKTLEIATTVTDASCGNSDGSITLSVTGGTPTYKYIWNNGTTGAERTNIKSGIYDVTILDNLNCIITQKIEVNDAEGPVISVNNIVNPGCDEKLGIVDVNITEGVAPYSYKWSNGIISEDLSNVNPGNYYLAVTDNAGCKSFIAVEIKDAQPQINPICVVLVDSITGSNLISWEKIQSNGIAAYNIYKESSMAGIYNLIASVPYNDLSVYVDTFSNPTIRSWRYKMTSMDSCGNESPLSAEHKTIHLTINTGLSGEINLIWDRYEGFSYGSYDIYRYAVSNGWELVATLPATLFSYTDANPPADTKKYYIAVQTPSTCTPSGGKKSNSGPFSRSLSNLEDNRQQGTIGFDPNKGEAEICIYPNPAISTLNIENMNNERIKEIRIYNITGTATGYYQINSPKALIDVKGFDKGMYFIQVNTENRIYTEKVLLY